MTFSELVETYPKYHQIKDAKTLPAGTNTDVILERLKQQIPKDYERISDMDGRASGLHRRLVPCKGKRDRAKSEGFSEGKTEDMGAELNRIAMEGLERAME